jgi:hypothetical protein
MRMLLVGVLSVTLIGCSCPVGRHAVLDACTSKTCFARTAASPPIEPKPTPFKPNRTITKVESKNAAKTAKTSAAVKAAKQNSPQTSNKSDKDKIASATPIVPDSSAPPPQPVESAKSTVGMNANVAVSGQASEASDPVLKKAKATVASKMEDPASVEFEDLTRAIRQSSIGPIDTICGHVKGKKMSGAETGKRAFLYLVKEDIAFVDYGYPNSVAATAYFTTCISRNLKSRIGP